jgi:4-methyl-5(b-hydroxyethyl)-thiazole monophosphate biosynthesis
MLIDDVDAGLFDALAVPGGFEEHGFYDEAYSDRVGELIRAFNAQDKAIASICVGALPLAHSGVLEGRRATTYHLGDGRRRRQLADFGVDVSDQPIVRDGNVVTSTSPATAIDVALLLLEALTDAENAHAIRLSMGFSED